MQNHHQTARHGNAIHGQHNEGSPINMSTKGDAPQCQHNLFAAKCEHKIAYCSMEYIHTLCFVVAQNRCSTEPPGA